MLYQRSIHFISSINRENIENFSCFTSQRKKKFKICLFLCPCNTLFRLFFIWNWSNSISKRQYEGRKLGIFTWRFLFKMLAYTVKYVGEYSLSLWPYKLQNLRESANNVPSLGRNAKQNGQVKLSTWTVLCNDSSFSRNWKKGATVSISNNICFLHTHWIPFSLSTRFLELLIFIC